MIRQPEAFFAFSICFVAGLLNLPDITLAYAVNRQGPVSFRRDTYMVSYVGRTDWGGMAEYIRSAFTITDGNLMLEVNSLPDKFCVTFQVLSKDRKPLDRFCEVLQEEGLPFTVSDRLIRYMPDLVLPKPGK